MDDNFDNRGYSCGADDGDVSEEDDNLIGLDLLHFTDGDGVRKTFLGGASKSDFILAFNFLMLSGTTERDCVCKSNDFVRFAFANKGFPVGGSDLHLWEQRRLSGDLCEGEAILFRLNLRMRSAGGGVRERVLGASDRDLRIF